jgi:hypothetical protein
VLFDVAILPSRGAAQNDLYIPVRLNSADTDQTDVDASPSQAAVARRSWSSDFHSSQEAVCQFSSSMVVAIMALITEAEAVRYRSVPWFLQEQHGSRL